MPTKIRLARHGRKRKPLYHIVVSDSRAPRDGRFIEKLGLYNPNTNPATIDLDFDRALDWLQKGAQPTDTCRAILSYKGILYKNHLLNGAKKGAFSEEEAEKRFQTWLNEKENKIESKKEQLNKAEKDLKSKQLESEAKVNEARAALIAKKLAAQAAEETEAVEEEASEETVQEEAVAETVQEEAAPEADVPEVKEEVESAPEAAAEPSTEEETNSEEETK